VTKGQVRVESAGDGDDLSAGDSASYRADVPHAILNQGRTEAVAYLVVVYR
jgi:quercetin dioxygenase-like cupin family protein